MAKHLVSFVHVFDDEGVDHAFGPEDTVPKWAADKMGDHCFTDGPSGSGPDKPAKASAKS